MGVKDRATSGGPEDQIWTVSWRGSGLLGISKEDRAIREILSLILLFIFFKNLPTFFFYINVGIYNFELCKCWAYL